MRKPESLGVEIKPIVPNLWPDLEALFSLSPAGSCSGCWCMWWNVKRGEFDAMGAKGRKSAFKRMVLTGKIHGLIAYIDGVPAAWLRLGPRKEFPVLSRSPLLKPIDDRPVWSIVCFFTGAAFRGRGITKLLIEDACRYSASRGALIMEAYPKDDAVKSISNLEAFTGVARVFSGLGFYEAARRKHRPIMRKVLS